MSDLIEMGQKTSFTQHEQWLSKSLDNIKLKPGAKRYILNEYNEGDNDHGIQDKLQKFQV